MGLILLSGMLFSGCLSKSPHEAIVYTAHDQRFSEPLLDRFTAQSSIPVRAKYDVESTKSVGLASAIMVESGKPVCDVFWNNEILNTIRLQKKGLLQPYRPPIAQEYPAAFQDPAGMWYGFAARARILIVNTELVDESERPHSIHDLANPHWKRKTGIAKPLYGTTATHAACLFAKWGETKAKTYFRQLQENEIQIVSGNKQVALDVAHGRLAFGLTDTDDALAMIDDAFPVVIVYPDQRDGEDGTLFIPNTVSLIRGAPHSESGKRLVDFLLSREVERALALGEAGQIPLNPNVDVVTKVETPQTIRPFDIDFHRAAEAWDVAAEFIAAEF